MTAEERISRDALVKREENGARTGVTRGTVLAQAAALAGAGLVYSSPAIASGSTKTRPTTTGCMSSDGLPCLPPDFEGFRHDLKFAMENSVNQAVLTKDRIGVLATFGDHVYTFSVKAGEIELAKGCDQLVRGVTKTTATGHGLSPGNSFSHVQRFEDVSGENPDLVFTQTLTLLDKEARLFAVEVTAGRVDEPPSFTISSTYDAIDRMYVRPLRSQGQFPKFRTEELNFGTDLIRKDFGSGSPIYHTGRGSGADEPTGSINWKCVGACAACFGALGCCLSNPLCCPSSGVCALCYECDI